MGVHEPSLNITLPLVLLAFGSIFVGYLAKEVALSNVIPPVVSNYIKMTPLLLSLSGAMLAFVVYDFLVAYAARFNDKRGVSLYIYQSAYTFFNSA